MSEGWLVAVSGCALIIGTWGWIAAFLLWKRCSSSPVLEAVGSFSTEDERLDYYADAFPGSLVLVDRMGTPLIVNEEARVRFGERLRAILRHPAARSALSAALKVEPLEGTALRPVCSTTLTLDVPVKRTVYLALRHLPDDDSRNSRVVIMLADRSDAQVADRMRADFVAHASHELRTPLASLSGFIDVLRDDATGGNAVTRKEFLEIMAKQSARMRRLIDRLLYLSHVQMRGHKRPKDILEIDELFAVVLGEVAPRFEKEGCQLHFSQDEGLSICADEDELVQVLLNMIENALRYARRDDRVLEIEIFAKSILPDDTTWPVSGGVLIGVRDNGPGIEAHHLPRLSERFYRVSNGRNAEEQGTGLGLSIVKQILDRHQGRFRVESVYGEGTSCLVWFPPVK